MRRIALLGFIAVLAFGCTHSPQHQSTPEISALALWAPWSPPLAGHAARQSTWDRTGANSDNIQIAPGETVTLFEADGPGIIRHIWCTSSLSDPMPRTNVIRMWWDGQEEPSVVAPLGDFFGVGHGMSADVHSFPITVNADGRSRNCWWPMPFANGAKITLTNEGPEPQRAFYCYVDWFALDDPPPTRERFHAQYRQEHPADSPDNYVYLDTEGEGHYVGVVHSIESTEPNWWGEGDDLIEIDGHEPLRGTGTEDYFSDAWGTREYMQLWHGVPVCEGFDTPGLRTTQFRFHILDPIPFQERIRVSIEHGTENDREDNHSSVAFWYQTLPSSPFPPLPAAIDRLLNADLQSHIRAQAFTLASSGGEGAIEELNALLPRADETHQVLLRGMIAYREGLDGDPAPALERVNRELEVIDAIIAAIPEDELYRAPAMDLPTDSDALIPADALLAREHLLRAHHDLARRAALVRGHLIEGDEILVESQNSLAEPTPAPLLETTSDWTYSYAKAEDPHLMGRGALFTYGDADPSWARITPTLPKAGRYEIMVIFSYGSNSSDTRWEVRHAEGMDTVPMEQRGRLGTEDRNSDVWHSIGTYRFNAGQSADHGSVTLNAAPGTSMPNTQFEHRAYIDSVRFIYRGQ